LRRLHHEGFLKAPQITAQRVTVSSVGLRAPALARPAHKFTRLNHSSGLSALLRNFSLPMAANPADATSRVRFEQFQRLAAPFPTRSTFLLGRRGTACAVSQVMVSLTCRYILKNNIRSKPGLSRNCRFSGSSGIRGRLDDDVDRASDERASKAAPRLHRQRFSELDV
jgi:hypothetical protein